MNLRLDNAMAPSASPQIDSAPNRRLAVLSRIAAGLLGGWAFTFGFSSLTVASLVAAGVEYAEAHTFAMLLAFVVFLVVFLWAFAARSVVRVWFVLGGSGGALMAAAWLLARMAT
jgi:hypothetical protein